MTKPERPPITNSHWGAYAVRMEGGRPVALDPLASDPDPSEIGQGQIATLDDPLRIRAPMVRAGWLEHGPGGGTGAGRGREPFVETSWEEVERLLADELRRVIDAHGNEAIFAGSYGWASAGRFHHAKTQLKRFLNTIGGFTTSVDTYSFAAAEVIGPHVLGSWRDFVYDATDWSVIAEATELFVAFGGVPLKNGQISQGGTGAHGQRGGIEAAHAAGTRFVSISPLASDMPVPAERMTPRPCTDVALMLGLCHTLLAEGLHDRAFLDRCTTGFDRFAAHLRGEDDGTPKTAAWAAEICAVPAEEIAGLARRMAASRTMISIAWALTRQDHGEQPIWAAVALASMLGQIGLPGGGIGFGYSATDAVGRSRRPVRFASVPGLENPVRSFIPVARVAEMMESPGAPFAYDGGVHAYPDIRLVWWAGGNPFHHHQDLNRLRRAWARPETVVVNDWCWTATARHADIVLPCTTTLERRDLSLTGHSNWVTVMDPVAAPVGAARDDHEIFRGIARRLGTEAAFTEDRAPDDWLRWLWDLSRQNAAEEGVELPGWDALQREGAVRIPDPERPAVMLDAFRADPAAHPLKTPSGRIELFSETVAGFALPDCPGHPAWMAPAEWLGNARPEELHLMSNQPRTKLHSQLDHGPVSRADEIEGRAAMLMHPRDAAARGLVEGRLARVWNDRGACLAGVRLSEEIMPGVVLIATGSWYDPDGETCLHGNPNALTRDAGCSGLSQGPSAHGCLVRVAPLDGPAPPTRAHLPPEIRRRDADAG